MNFSLHRADMNRMTYAVLTYGFWYVVLKAGLFLTGFNTLFMAASWLVMAFTLVMTFEFLAWQSDLKVRVLLHSLWVAPLWPAVRLAYPKEYREEAFYGDDEDED